MPWSSGWFCIACCCSQVERVIRSVALAVKADHLADRDRARDVARSVPAHAVGDDEQVRTGIPRVLVHLSHKSDVRAGGKAQCDLQGDLLPQLEDGFADAQGRTDLDWHR